MKTIAVINFGPLGDVINSSPVCMTLKENYPDSRLIFITSPAGYPGAECIPGVDKVYCFDRRGKYKGMTALVKESIKLRFKEKIDLAVIINESFRTAIYTFLAGAKIRAGRDCDGRGFMLTHKLPFLSEERELKIHVSEQYMRVLKPLGLYKKDYEPGFIYSRADMDYIDEIIRKEGYLNSNLIGICPCAGEYRCKDWAFEEFAEFIKNINQTSNRKIIITGTAEAAVYAEKLREMGITDFLDMSLKTSVGQLGALISRCNIFVSADTGPMHIAFALKTPTVALFMQENYLKWGPKDKYNNELVFVPVRINAETAIQAYTRLDGKQDNNLISQG